MIDDKEDYNKYKTADIVPKIPKEEIKIDSKPKLQMLRRRRTQNKTKDDACSKSVSNIEICEDSKAKNIKKLDLSQIKFKLKMKKRPNSAKNNGKIEKELKPDAETNKKLHEIFEKLKKFHENKSNKKNEENKITETKASN